jgi:hypothetical protein
MADELRMFGTLTVPELPRWKVTPQVGPACLPCATRFIARAGIGWFVAVEGLEACDCRYECCLLGTIDAPAPTS